ncbi:type II secretion system protein GspM [Cupriavidus basilensis]|uniref:Type II secretion system protein M n=1 Tax=Cupriavidus basilensis TaxID=68895 RepID=A0A7M2HB31_9BURK|nr:type II secretion system protein GspM [Cupriavidus basilensis]QOT81993.1 type II secretion system protein M [Cupriavidus basilensis]
MKSQADDEQLAMLPRQLLRRYALHVRPLLARARAAWLARAPRERRALLLCALVLSATLGWYVGWEPATNAIVRLERDLPLQREQAAQIQALAAQAAALRALPDPTAHTPGEWKSALTAALARHGIADASVRVEGSTLRVRVPRISFHAWMQWLESVRKEYGVKPLQLDAKTVTGAEEGQVSIEAELSAPSGAKR